MAAQCCTSRIVAFKWDDLPLAHSFSVICETITINHKLPTNRLFELYFCGRQYASNFEHREVMR